MSCALRKVTSHPYLRKYWYRVNTEKPDYMLMIREEYAEQNERQKVRLKCF
jgi:hypothetical protein